MNTTRHSIIRSFGYSVIGAAALGGCTLIPSIGPNYEEPVLEVPEYVLPDAGQPTTNLTATFEYKPAESNDDKRVTVSKNVIEKWWERFDDPILVKLVEGGVSNNVGYLMAQKRLEQRNYELLGTLPMMIATGAGAASRNHLGTTEFWGMGASVAFGILLVPGLYALFQTWRENAKRFFAYIAAKAARQRELKSRREI